MNKWKQWELNNVQDLILKFCKYTLNILWEKSSNGFLYINGINGYPRMDWNQSEKGLDFCCL